EEAEALLKDSSRIEYIDPRFVNQHQFAMPDELVWSTLGANEEYMPEGYLCPRGAEIHGMRTSKEELDRERSRNYIIYQLICESGPLHVEDLWKVLLNTQKRDPFPFDGFFGFYRFITHIFLVDSQRMVYNQNILVTVAVMRYAHSLYHRLTTKLYHQMTTKLFKGVSSFVRLLRCHITGLL
ncbi:hypothetical protein PMAYCL1PPCAC_14465, partial [Pristionchus mayeri]